MSRFQIVAAVLGEEMAKPYAPGSTDCFYTGLAVVDALRGTSLLSKYNGRYRTLRGAQRALRKEGHKTLATFFAAFLEPVAPAQATVGDIAVVVEDGVEHVAVCTGHSFRAKTERGPRDYSFATVKAAFRT